MSNKKKLVDTFIDALQLDVTDFNEGLEYNTIAQWDSTGHMILIAAIESSFDVMLDMDDIIDMSSFSKATEILQKYNINFAE